MSQQESRTDQFSAGGKMAKMYYLCPLPKDLFSIFSAVHLLFVIFILKKC
jgi:hypothetical protein